MESISDYKDALRKAMRYARDILARDMLEYLSNIIEYRVLTLDKFKEAEIVGGYYPIGSEVQTFKILDFVLKNKVLALPKVDKEIKFVRVDNLKELVKGRYNIMEPRGEITKPDLILVPAIAFDEKGYRIGYGKGYYDKYLSKNDCYSIGLAYDFQVLKEIPHEDHDIRVDMIVTDKRIILVT
ncbi:MAG: 5-formyltetrahydrofolate cyclo-ligase [Candidatus Nitrosocaldaceae archaeon]|nr:MAG: 5-formyltetrahydrofolate cyclo-ligase [Candidatus Nitrosocaldaceae archaeon]